MSNSGDLRVGRNLDLLASLKETVAKFAKREEQISRDISSRRYNTTLKSQHAITRTESSHAGQIAAMEESSSAEEERIKTIYEARRARIQKFRKNSLMNLPRRAQEVKGSWMGDLQMKSFIAERNLANDLAAADAASSTLELNRTTLDDLEFRARKAFGGYGIVQGNAALQKQNDRR